jgi:hypothetical protein
MENTIHNGVSDFIQKADYAISMTLDSANIAANGSGKKIISAGTALGVAAPFAKTKKARVAVLPSLTTALTGANNDLVFTGKNKNAVDSQPLKIAYIDPSANSQTLKLDYSIGDNTINVLLATSGAGAITTTATEIMELINKNIVTRDLVTAALADSNTGAGVVIAMSATALSGAYPAFGYAVNTVDVTDGDLSVSVLIEGVVYNTVTDHQIPGIKIIPK